MNKIFLIGLAVLVVVLFLGCVQQAGTDSNSTENITADITLRENNMNGNSDVVENGDTIKVEYVGKFLDGNVFDKSEGRGPLEFTAGAGQMIQGFDEAVIGMKLNEEKTVTIPAEKAYGTDDDVQSVDVPLAQIQGGEDGNVTVGTILYNAQGMPGTVTQIKEGIATIAFRHPLAGQTLVFWIKIFEIKKA